MHRVNQAVALGIVGLALAGCGSSAGAAPAQSAQPTSAANASAPNDAPLITLPLDVYESSAVENHNATLAYQLLIAKCMQGHGYHLADVQPPATDAWKVDQQSRFGLNSLQDARVYGFTPDAVRRAASANVVAEPTLSAAEMAVLGGPTTTGPSGCTGEAWKQLGNVQPDGSSVLGQGLAYTLERTALSHSLADPRVVAADSAWSTCMAKQGYDYKDPSAASADPRWKPASAISDAQAAPMPSAQEINAAVADVTCNRQVHYIDIMTSVNTEYQKQLLNQNFAALQAEKVRNDAVLTKAATVLANG